MKVAIIGAGNVGATLGRGWATHGHEITYAVRDPESERVKAAVDSTQNGRAATLNDGCAGADVVLLATPWEAAEDAVKAAGDLSGKVLIDATNPILPGLAGLSVGTTTSAAEMIAEWAPGARVVKAFNTIGAMHMGNPSFKAAQADAYICGDDEAAKEDVTQLAQELGFDVVDCGPLNSARLLEPLAMLWIHLAYQQGFGPDIAFKLILK